MTEDILNRIRRTTSNPDLPFSVEMYNEALILIEDLCLQICRKLLVQLGQVNVSTQSCNA